MSFAWALVAAAGVTTVLSFYCRPDLSILRPSFTSWRSVVSFGGYNGVSFVINQAYEALPQLVLGRILPYSAVGLYNRAQAVSAIPNQVILASVFSVAFPALAAEVRQGRDLKEPYLRHATQSHGANKTTSTSNLLAPDISIAMLAIKRIAETIQYSRRDVRPETRPRTFTRTPSARPRRATPMHPR
jgi:hypothetical protein